MPSIRRIWSSAWLNPAKVSVLISATRSQRPLVVWICSTSAKPLSARITLADFSPSIAMHMTARTRPPSASGAVLMVKPRITRSVRSRAMRFCTVPRETLSFLARPAAGSRALARSSANNRRSVSSIISLSIFGETAEIWRILADCGLFASIASRSDFTCDSRGLAMRKKALFLMTDARHFGVTYQINPWMRPDAWQADPAGLKMAALASAAALRAALERIGASVKTVPAAAELPDLVFPANAAVVLDGRVLVARFRHPERQGEEEIFRAAFLGLKTRGLVCDVLDLPEGVLQEGAGDCIWDKDRGFF